MKSIDELEKVKEKLIADYWFEKLRDVESSMIGELQQYDTLSVIIEKKLSDLISNAAKGRPLNVFCLYLTIYKILLYKYFASRDLLVASFSCGFVNSHPDKNILLFYKSQLNENGSLLDYIRVVANELQESFTRSDYSEETGKVLIQKSKEIPFLFCFNPTLDLQTEFGSLRLTIVQKAEDVQIAIQFNKKLYSNEFICQFIEHYNTLLEYIEDINVSISQIEILSSKQHQVIQGFNNTKVNYPSEKTILDFINEQVKLHPHAVAVAGEDGKLTYKELDEKANQLANYLRKIGVQNDQIVGICIDRSLSLMIGLLGILKSGAAYLPIDPNYPSERINYLLEDSAIDIFVTTSNYCFLVANNRSIIALAIDEEEGPVQRMSTTNPAINIHPNDLAYVIYTSGSTGRPKGVMNEHRGILNRLLWAQSYFNLCIDDNVLQKTTISFDVSVWELFWPLMFGAKLILAKPEGQKDSEYIRDIIEQQKITMLHFVPPMLEVFLETVSLNECCSLKKVLCSGEALHPHQVNLFAQKLPHAEIFNLYGPTEAAIDVTCWAHERQNEKVRIVPIGKPVANTQIRIVDSNGKDVPIGVPGELLIGGIQVGRGYMNRPELTAEKFISGAFDKYQGYKTGDVAKWMYGGDIQYLGRNDNQVKIRGFRIEIGEIEFVLSQCPFVSKCIIITNQDKSGIQRIVAYVVPKLIFDQNKIVDYLKPLLPEYMIPTYIVEIDKIPFLPNGKLDRNLLPDPEILLTNSRRPKNSLEHDLVKIWAAVLKIDEERISVETSFFEMGGDSIIAIQAVNKAKTMGYVLKSQDIFEKQTITALAQTLKKNIRISHNQQPITGQSNLIPIQYHFFENYNVEAPLYNQALLFEIDKSVDEGQLLKVIQALINHNDALRFVYKNQDNTWIQTYGEEKGNVEVLDLTDMTSTRVLQQALIRMMEESQQRLDILQGKLVAVALIKTSSLEIRNRLFIAIHHLVVDGVSWRILIEQFELALSSVRRSEPIELGIKSTSYRDCVSFLEKYAQSHHAQNQLEYWKDTVNSYIPLPVDGELLEPKFKDIESITTTLNKDLTTSLLTEVNKSVNTRIDDILLAAVAKTFCDWSGYHNLLIGFEGHGRESNERVDMTGTVGWFTNLYPVLITVMDEGVALVKSVKEQLRSVPDRGIGYGALRYLHTSPQIRQSMSQGKWDVLFNYQGQLDNAISPDGWLSIATESISETISGERAFGTKISIESFVAEGQLTITFNYGSTQYHKQTINDLSTSFGNNLKLLIDSCTTRINEDLTPSDYGLAPEVNRTDLNRFMQSIRAKGNHSPSSLARISPMQNHILLHKIKRPASEAYIVQHVYHLRGSIDVLLFEKSWNQLLITHDILTTAFFHDTFTIPIQVTYNNVEVPISLIDLTGLSETEQKIQTEFIAINERKMKFNFESPCLMRLKLIQRSEQAFTFVWTHHHLLMDGWSVQLLLRELLEIYNALKNERTKKTVRNDSYLDFIKFISSKDAVGYEEFWKNELKGMTSTLMFHPNSNFEMENRVAAEETLELNDNSTSLLINYAKRNHLTVNTIVQGVWTLIVSRITGKNDVIFGMTVTGRPPVIPNIDNKVGLYINTIPVRSFFQNDDTIQMWLQNLQNHHTKARDFQYISLSELQSWIGIERQLFDSVMVYQNYPSQTGGSDLPDANDLTITADQFWEHSDFPLSVMVALDSILRVRFGYYAPQVEPAFIDTLKRQFEHTLIEIINSTPDAPMSELTNFLVFENDR